MSLKESRARSVDMQHNIENQAQRWKTTSLSPSQVTKTKHSYSIAFKSIIKYIGPRRYKSKGV